MSRFQQPGMTVVPGRDDDSQYSDEENGFHFSTARFKKRLLSNFHGLGYLGARVGAIIMNLVLISLTGVYVNALVMSRAIDSHPIPIVMIVFFSLAELYLVPAFFVHIGEVKTGKRFLIMGAIDVVLLIVYALLATNAGLEVAAISCGTQQFTTTHLNRYGMGYFDYDHSLQSWAKSSFHHCQQAKAVFATCIILGISLVATGGLCFYIWSTSHRLSREEKAEERSRIRANRKQRDYNG